MAYGGFRLGTNGVYFNPPAGARPDQTAPAVVLHPAGSSRLITGQTISIGSSYAELGRQFIKQEGVDWWVYFLGGNESVTVNVCLYDPIRGAWCTFQGIMHQPTMSPLVRPGQDHAYTLFRVRLTELKFLGVDTVVHA